MCPAYNKPYNKWSASVRLIYMIIEFTVQNLSAERKAKSRTRISNQFETNSNYTTFYTIDISVKYSMLVHWLTILIQYFYSLVLLSRRFRNFILIQMKNLVAKIHKFQTKTNCIYWKNVLNFFRSKSFLYSCQFVLLRTATCVLRIKIT